MKITHKTNPFYHISLENIFTENDLFDIKAKLDRLKFQFKSGEYTGSSIEINGKIKKKNKGLFLLDCKNNSIINDFITNKIDNIIINVKTSRWKNFCFNRIYNKLEWGGDLIQYYGSDDYYEPHVDNGIFTMILWFYDDEKIISGGDLYFPEYDYLHQCKNNNGIIFFSNELHGVTTLKSKESFGRYSITTFSSFPELDDKNSINARKLLIQQAEKKIIYS